MPRVKFSRHLLVPVSLTYLLATILPYYSLCKISKNGNTSPIFNILFFNISQDLFKNDFFLVCIVLIKDSCIVDIENRRFYFLFLRLIFTHFIFIEIDSICSKFILFIHAATFKFAKCSLWATVEANLLLKLKSRSFLHKCV